MENNNLDKLFRNKLKDLKVSAPKDSWEAIAERLPRKEKRRPIVLWWSAAAVLLVFFASSVFYWSVIEKVPQNIPLVDIEKVSDTTPENIQLVETEKKSKVVAEKDYENSLATDDNTLENPGSTQPQDNLTTDNEYRSNSKFHTSKNKAVVDRSMQRQAVASQNVKEGKSETNSSSKQSIVQKQINKKAEEDKSKETLLVKQHTTEYDAKNRQETTDEQIAQTEVLKNKEEEKMEEVTSLLNQETSLAAEKEALENSKEKHGKWSVGPQVAPVYYSSVSAGSSLDNQFNNSGKKGGVNMSLGLQVAYQLNDNWQVRSGVHRMNVGYATNDVQVGYADPNLAIANINYNNAVAGDVVVTAFSNANLSNIQASQIGNKIEVLNIEGNTQLKQNITYLEVPIEIERKIIQSDFEWTVIGGVSSLFLTNNAIYVHNSDYSHQIGNANNLEKTSFTTNIGMGFGYNFTKNLHLKLEPMFKYQLNPYTNSVDFKPYMFGVYTGINWNLD